MLRPLTDPFDLRSSLAGRAPWDVDQEEERREVDEELDRRLRVYPQLVRAGTMKPADADRHVELWRAILADHDRLAAWTRRRLSGVGSAAEPDPAGQPPWDARVRELRRELALRRAAYPKWVASRTNPLTAEDAAHKLERLDAVHWRYWMGLFAFGAIGAPRTGDHACLTHIAERQEAREADRWNAAIAQRDDAGTAALAERVAWSAIVRLARHCGEGREWCQLLAGIRDLRHLAAAAEAANERACAIALTDRTHDPVVGQLAIVASWLGGIAARTWLPEDRDLQDERMAA